MEEFYNKKVAENSKSVDILRKIYEIDKSNILYLFEVKMALLGNPHCPSDILESVLEDRTCTEGSGVENNIRINNVIGRGKITVSDNARVIAAKNPNCPRYLLTKILSVDSTTQELPEYNLLIEEYAAKNYRCPPDVLRIVLERGKDDGVSQNAAENPNCPSDALVMVLERGKDDKVSCNAAENPNCPPWALQMVLEREINDSVSHYAVRNHNCPPVVKRWWTMFHEAFPKE